MKFATKTYDNTNLTLGMLLHYLGKYRASIARTVNTVHTSSNIRSVLFGFVTKHACDGQTDGRTDRITTANTALA